LPPKLKLANLPPKFVSLGNDFSARP